MQAMTRFARPSMPAKKWWDELSPLLSAQARTDYAYTDPANVPATKVTGKPSLADLDSVHVRIVQVPTDAGTYSITLSRSELDPDWVVERIAPPDSSATAM